MAELVTVEPVQWGIEFRRDKVHSQERYEKALGRYVRMWNRTRGLLIGEEYIDVLRDEWQHCFFVRFYWDAAAVPRFPAGAMAELSFTLAKGRGEHFGHFSAAGTLCRTPTWDEPRRCTCGEIELRYAEGKEARTDG